MRLNILLFFTEVDGENEDKVPREGSPMFLDEGKYKMYESFILKKGRYRTLKRLFNYEVSGNERIYCSKFLYEFTVKLFINDSHTIYRP